MRNPLTVTWRDRHDRPFVQRPHRIPFVATPGLDALSAWLRRLRLALIVRR